MKIPYKHIANYLNPRPNIEELSEKLFQLGHEHEIFEKIFDIEITPNRGDCLSLNGLLRDLRLFYEIQEKQEVYKKEIPYFNFEFKNRAEESCNNISFLKIEIDEVPNSYKNFLDDYFFDLNIKKTNFFTDVSNFLSYETGQPTHCYDFFKVNQPVTLNALHKETEFETLIDKKINIYEGDLVFCDKDNKVINLAGVVGGKNTECNMNTKSVIVECANFNPEVIIGKSLKYDVSSDAAYKFERGTDPCSHDYVLRRFVNIVESHTQIKKVELLTLSSTKKTDKLIPLDVTKINKILGTNINERKCLTYLNKLGFELSEGKIKVPTYRNDINTINDIAEEIARAIGYNNIEAESVDISIGNNIKLDFKKEKKIKKVLIGQGFYEVINNPFVNENSSESVRVDNPLDSNRKYLRTGLRDSLINNLLFNERRQKDSVKLFEISNIYTNTNTNESRVGKRTIGIIASGRVGKNYIDFSKKIKKNYLEEVLSKFRPEKYCIEEISRDTLNSKSKNKIFFCEFDVHSSIEFDSSFDDLVLADISGKKYSSISEFPSSFRDLSFSIKNYSMCKLLERFILSYKHNLLKEVFVFDYYENKEINEIKIGFRFIFQSKEFTIKDKDVDKVMKNVIEHALEHYSVTLPGIL
jgi:phenylalanyl-tRNA synthetase beta chain